MTTIAYNHKDQEIAYDSRTSMDGIVIFDSAIKMTESNDVLFFFCGKACDESLAIKSYFGEEIKLIPEVSGFVFDKGNFYYISFSDECILHKYPINHDMAIGSGGHFALSAMDFGCNAEDAVKYAATRDIYTGGKINVFKAKALNGVNDEN